MMTSVAAERVPSPICRPAEAVDVQVVVPRGARDDGRVAREVERRRPRPGLDGDAEAGEDVGGEAVVGLEAGLGRVGGEEDGGHGRN